MKNSIFPRVFGALKSLGIDSNLPYLIIGNKAINLKMNNAVWNYIYIQKILQIGIDAAREKEAKNPDNIPDEKRKEQSFLLFLAERLMGLNAFLSISAQKDTGFYFAKEYSPDLPRVSLPALKDIYRQRCMEVIEAVNEIWMNIEVNLHCPENQFMLGSTSISKPEAIAELESLKEYRHAVCQMINIQRELDTFSVAEVVGKEEKAEPKKSDGADLPQRELNGEFRKIFLDSEFKWTDQNCLTVVNLEKMFNGQAEPLKQVLDRGFRFSISDNKKPEMFISDQTEWSRYRERSSARFRLRKSSGYFYLLPSLSKKELVYTMEISMKYFEKLVRLFEKAKKVYFKLKLDDIWPDYRIINVSRVDWTDISVNYLDEMLNSIEDAEKENPDGARHMFKVKVIEGILMAPSHRATPLRDSWLEIPLYDDVSTKKAEA